MFKYILFVSIFTGMVIETHAQADQEKTDHLSCYNIIVSDLEWPESWGRKAIDWLTDEISIQDQIKAGNEIVKLYREYGLVGSNSVYNKRLNRLLERLVTKIENPKGYQYEIFYIDEPDLNAFTSGAKILITKSMIDFCNSDDELAVVIGHEIMHNELGHIERSTRKSNMMDTLFGDYSIEVNDLVSYFSNPFDQKDEAYCDMYGIDLAVRAGFKPCLFKKLWERIALEEDEDGSFSQFLSTHPGSDARATCIGKYIFKKYNINCSE